MRMNETRKTVSFLVLTATALLGGCTLNDRSPEGATRLFVEAVVSHKTDRVIELLAPATRKKVDALAKLASAQTGGRQHYKPEDMLVAGMQPPLHNLGDSWEAAVQKEQGDRAEVRITSADKKHQQSFHLVRVGESWRVTLPDVLLGPLPQPAKRTTGGDATRGEAGDASP